MLFSSCLLLLVVIELASAGYGVDKAPQHLPAPPFCNDEVIKTLAHKMELIEVSNQNIQLKLHTSHMYNYQQFEDLKTAIYSLDDHHKDKSEHCDCNTTTWANLAASSSASGSRSTAQAVALDENSNASGASTAANVAAVSNASAIIALLPTYCQPGRTGIQQIQLANSTLHPFFVNCIQDQRQSGDQEPWLLIQRRRDGSIDFYRDWCDYQTGFGNLEGEFFIGLDKLHALTQSALHELWIELEDFENQTRWAKYSTFAIGDESQGYALNMLGNYSGDAGDSLIYHQGQKFSTKDKDLDAFSLSCAQNYYGAWWYKECHHSNLNGKYLRGAYPKDKTAIGIDWDSWHGHNYSLKYVHMAIRPVRSN